MGLGSGNIFTYVRIIIVNLVLGDSPGRIRLETAPGHQAGVELGEGGWLRLCAVCQKEKEKEEDGGG